MTGSIIPICGTGITEYVHHSKRNIIAFRPLQEMYSPFQIYPLVKQRLAVGEKGPVVSTVRHPVIDLVDSL
jgi:hypothetical protein